jgi:hypothetical protein
MSQPRGPLRIQTTGYSLHQLGIRSVFGGMQEVENGHPEKTIGEEAVDRGWKGWGRGMSETESGAETECGNL